MQRWAILSISGAGILLGLLVWREWAHAGNRKAWGAESQRLQASLSDTVSGLEEKREALTTTRRTLEELQINHDSLRDRVTNLEAQRNHLRAETNRQSERARLADLAVKEIKTELESARQQILELTALPRELQAKLDQAEARLKEMESSLDRQAGLQSLYPASLDVEGVATDGSVFALTGPLPEANALPLPVYVCQRDSIRLEGWINRLENGVAIGHVEQWHSSASTLVKGEKVFILPRHRYEADN
ncbi:hypothetical protein G0Q06_12760 [Puniceicoccales bacterium CK1056]|uniref:Chromosome partition protein Smc n=1 Tax=Oceanipulchritudo coccoides TaxID=2706888 RepID=A0A6B2M574_9BACT|nr:hypothetical protein [Oceanipulchritudo coccoides]NDV63329.1 hypothetical protein [Oceanipulchritudo coccoides]